MIDQIVSSFDPIAIMGGMGASDGTIKAVMAHADTWVAADGGAQHVLEAGLMPAAVIGDLDSIAPPVMARLSPQRIHRITEQDSTDFEKCLLRVSAPVILAVGMLGGRLDHQLVALHALMRFAAQPCVLVGEDEIVFLCPPRLHLDMPAGIRVSLFPLGCVLADARGLKWSFEQLALAPGGRVGTSNETIGPVDIACSEPSLLCILPRTCLGEVVKQLVALPAQWPARA